MNRLAIGVIGGVLLTSVHAHAACIAPSAVSLEQVGDTIKVAARNDGCAGSYLRIFVNYKGFFTNILSAPTQVGIYRTSISPYQIPLTSEGLYSVRVESCITNGPCVSAPAEEIYFVVDRDAYAKNWDIPWKVPVKGVDYPDTVTYNFCKTLQSRGCDALSTSSDPNKRGQNRFVLVPASTAEKPFQSIYPAYDVAGTYLRQIQEMYNRPGQPVKYLHDLLQGVIDSADFTDREDGGIKHMVIRPTPDLYPDAGEMGRAFKMLGRLLESSTHSDREIYKYRWTILSLFRMMNFAFQVNYDYAKPGVSTNRGGLRTRLDSTNTQSGVTWLHNFLVSFPAGFALDRYGKPLRQKPQVCFGKSMQAERDILYLGWEIPVKPHVNDFYGIDLDSDYDGVIRFMRRVIQRVGEPPRRVNFTAKNMLQFAQSSPMKVFPYGFYLRDEDWTHETFLNQAIYIGKTTTITKACGGFGGYLDWGTDPVTGQQAFKALSKSDIGQMIGLYWMLFDKNLGDNSLIPSRSDHDRTRRDGWAYIACPSRGIMLDGVDCDDMIELLKTYFESWRDVCCAKLRNDVYVQRTDGTYKLLKDLSEGERNSRPEYPQYCRP